MNLEFLNQYSEHAVPALALLLALIVLLIIVKAIGNKVSGRRGNRLAVSEFHEIDKSRRLVLVRRDDVEHLVMIGGSQDLVIEEGIGARPAAPEPSRRLIPRREPAMDSEPADHDDRVTPMPAREPKPAVFGDRAPNLRPVERSEPQLGPAKSDTER